LTIDAVFRFCAGRATVFMAAALVVGLIAPPLSTALGPLLPTVVWTVLFLSLVRTDWTELAAYRRRPVLVGAAVFFVLVASPFLMWAVLLAFERAISGGFSTALVMMAASSPFTAVAAVALILGLDAAFALVILVATTLLMPFLLPLLIIDVLGLDLALDALGLMRRLALLVGIAVSLAVIVKLAAGRERLSRNAFRIDGLTVMFLVFFGVALMDGVTAQILADPFHVGVILVFAFAANLALVTAGTLIFWRVGRRLALTLGYAAGNGNMAILLAVLPVDADAEIGLYFALGQFPMFMLPMMLKPLFHRILARR
jgi:BASS family bile acid:Na+ symporter